MTFISTKKIGGKKRHYIEKSVRLTGGKVGKVSIFIKDYDPEKKKGYVTMYHEAVEAKAVKKMAESAARAYRKSRIFDEETLMRLEEARIGYLKIIRKLSKNQIQDVIDRFTANFTYESNAIEGNSLTLKDVTFIFKENRTLSGKDLREVYESLNTREAMELIFKGKLKTDERNIIGLHKILVKNTGIREGYKRLPNFLLGRTVKTAPPEKVGKEMLDLINRYHRDKNIHPLERAADFHGKFEQIHPFEDGNGRTGRLFVNAILIDNGYPPLIIRTSQRTAYFSALSAFDHGYKDKLQRFLIERYLDTYEKFFKVYVRYL